jgi:leucyl-tRNA synthetase
MAERDYNFQEIELKWQDRWERSNTFATKRDDGREKYYLLEMFPTRRAGSTWGTCATTP